MVIGIIGEHMKGLLAVQLREVGLASGSVNRISYFEWKHAEAFIYKITPTLLGLTCIPLDTLHSTSVALYGKTKRGRKEGLSGTHLIHPLF